MNLFLQDHSPALVAAVGLIVVYFFYRVIQAGITYHRRTLISRNHGCKPLISYPHKDPILGLDIFLRNLKLSHSGGFMEDIKARYKTIGPDCHTFSQLLLGNRMILTCEPENIKVVLATQFKDFEIPQRRKDALQPIFGHGIFTTNGAEWEASRALLRPNFVRSQIGDLDTFESHISKLISRIPKDGSTVDMQPLFFLLTMDSDTEFLFGHSTNCLGETGDHRPGERFSDAFTYATFKAGIQNRVGKLATLIPDKKYKDDVAFIHEYVHGYVQKAVNLAKTGGKQEKTDSKYIFLEELAKTGYSAKKIQDELLNILLAGRDTTASLLSWLFYFLARRPDVVKKLREEISSLGKTRPSFEDLKAMKYLQYCLNETLRLWPIVPANNRIAVRDTTLPLGGGLDGKSPIFVKAGQTILYQPYVMQRRKDLYGEDADEFKPERWEHLRPGWQYLPFNGGPRICIGQQFALTEASYTTVRLLQAFKGVEKADDSEMLELLTLTAAVRAGVNVKLVPS